MPLGLQAKMPPVCLQARGRKRHITGKQSRRASPAPGRAAAAVAGDKSALSTTEGTRTLNYPQLTHRQASPLRRRQRRRIIDSLVLRVHHHHLAYLQFGSLLPLYDKTKLPASLPAPSIEPPARPPLRAAALTGIAWPEIERLSSSLCTSPIGGGLIHDRE